MSLQPAAGRAPPLLAPAIYPAVTVTNARDVYKVLLHRRHCQLPFKETEIPSHSLWPRYMRFRSTCIADFQAEGGPVPGQLQSLRYALASRDGLREDHSVSRRR